MERLNQKGGIKCPHCGKVISHSEIAKHLGSLGRGKSKARPYEVARQAALKGWITRKAKYGRSEDSG